MHVAAGRKRNRLERNMKMETAYHAALVPHQKNPPRLIDLLIPEDGPATRRRQSWQEMKAHLILGLGGPKTEA